MKKLAYAVLAASLVSVTTGCTYRATESYSRQDAYQAMNVEYGTVREIRHVNMQGYSNGVGAVTGAVIGGVTGNAVSGRWDKGLGTMLGILIGGLVGTVAQENMTQQPGWELIVQTDNGRNVAIAVPATGTQFVVGQRVKLMEGSNSSRVVPSDQGYQPQAYPQSQSYPQQSYPQQTYPSNSGGRYPDQHYQPYNQPRY